MDDDEPVDELAARRESGGARATKKKHDERAGRRKRGNWHEKHWLDRYQKLADEMPSDTALMKVWQVKAQALVFAEAMTDPGPPPEVRRQQAISAGAALTKSIDLAQLGQKISEQERALEEMAAGGAEVDPGAGGRAPPKAPRR